MFIKTQIDLVKALDALELDALKEAIGELKTAIDALTTQVEAVADKMETPVE